MFFLPELIQLWAICHSWNYYFLKSDTWHSFQTLYSQLLSLYITLYILHSLYLVPFSLSVSLTSLFVHIFTCNFLLLHTLPNSVTNWHITKWVLTFGVYTSIRLPPYSDNNSYGTITFPLKLLTSHMAALNKLKSILSLIN